MATLPQTIHLTTPLPGPEARTLDERAGAALPRALTAAMPTFARRTDRGVRCGQKHRANPQVRSIDEIRHQHHAWIQTLFYASCTGFARFCALGLGAQT